MKRLLGIAIPALLVSSLSSAFAASFGYYGENGPDFWSELDPGYSACNSGSMQSPTDLGRQRAYPHLDFDYDSVTTGEIFNNGHTIEVETEGDNTLWLDGKAYELSQFHFHTASEHRVQGRGYDMEMHLVHTSQDGKNAVVGVFLKRGDSSGALAPIFESLPPIGGELNVKYELEDSFDPAAFLPASDKHYRYLGSLTTPPCTEGVEWVVMLEPITVLDEDMAQFAARISFNARYTQREVPTHP
jgi:carbonic anhydrase